MTTMTSMTNAEAFLNRVFPADREWWEKPPIVVRFAEPKVREKLNKLIGTDTVKISDREFMRKLSVNRNKVYQKQMDKRIKDRVNWEVERKKQLILEGLLPMSEGPQSLIEHPIFRISKEIRTIINKRQQVADYREQSKRKVPQFNYRLLERDGETLSTPSEVSVISDRDFLCPDIVEDAREICQNVLADEFEAGYMADKKTVDTFHYIPPDIKRLKETLTVDEMYKAADDVLGHFSREPSMEIRASGSKVAASSDVGVTDSKEQQPQLAETSSHVEAAASETEGQAQKTGSTDSELD